MSSVGPVLSLLREETAANHRRLELRMDAIERLAHQASRGDLVQRYHRFHEAAEAAVGAWGLDLPTGEWRRAPALAQGLRDLELPPMAPTGVLSLNSRGEALGALYVLEGSALGGRTILKSLQRRGASCRGLDFLDPYGDAIAAHWRTFVDYLEREVAEPADAVVGAQATFDYACTVLCVQEQVH